jgi:predicted MFS family arabinose efflux permease
MGIPAQKLALLLAVCVGSGLAHVGTSTMPLQVGALVDASQRSATEAGLFGFFEVSALALGMMLISSWVDRIPPRRIAFVGCAIIAVANFGLYSLTALWMQLALAAAVGFGYGLVFAATVAGTAAVDEPDRFYALGNGGALLLIVGLLAVIPSAAGRFGSLGIFLVLAAPGILSAPFFLGFTRGKPLQETRLSALRTPGAWGLLVAWAACSAGTSGLYAFSERIGRSIQLDAFQISAVLSAGVFIGLVGTGAAAIFGRRLHRPTALLIGGIGSTISCVLLGFATNLTLYATGVFVYWIFYMFLYSYLLGTAAILDPSGRVGTLGGGVERFGYASGAAMAGFLADHSTYSATGALGFVLCLGGMLIGFPSLFRAVGLRAGNQGA